MGNKANAPNWKKIKAEYIKGGISLRDIAKKYKVPYSTISKRAASEKWSDARQTRGIKMESKLVEKIADQQATKLARMAVLHDDIGEAALALILKQIQAFPTSASTTRIIRETIKTQEIQDDDGNITKVPLRTNIISDISEVIRNFASISKDLGFDEASKLQRQKVRIDSGAEQMDSDGGFIDALDAARPDAWEMEDVPLNLTDSETDGGDAS